MSLHVPGSMSSMGKQASIPVTLPRPNPTIASWQVPLGEIADLRSTQELPQKVDVLIIGSGISGACIALNVLSQRPQEKVSILEARQACSGATGRNGCVDTLQASSL